jgi:L-ribulose-5-phosphate 3-epimerase
MINIGFRAHDLGKNTPEDLAIKLDKYNFSSIQLALNKAILNINYTPGKLSSGFGNYIRNTLWKKNIDIAVLGCYINPVHPDINQRKIELDKFMEHLKFAKSFGCSIVGTETGSSLPNCGFTPDIYTEENFNNFISSLRVLVRCAEKFGVMVGIEAVADKHSIHSHERLSRVLELVPSDNLGIIYDPVNLLPNNQLDNNDNLMKEAFELFSHKIVAIHAKDYIIEDGVKNGNLPSGAGLLNYPLLFDLIKKYKPYCHVLLENNTPDTVSTTVDFINKTLKDIQ